MTIRGSAKEGKRKSVATEESLKMRQRVNKRTWEKVIKRKRVATEESLKMRQRGDKRDFNKNGNKKEPSHLGIFQCFGH
jgi:hypothetical protein